jgi:hypothetical protein
MPEIFSDINHTEKMRFWVSELTSFTPREVDSVLKVIKAKRTSQIEQIAS